MPVDTAALLRHNTVRLLAVIVAAAFLGGTYWFISEQKERTRKDTVRILRDTGLADILRYKEIDISFFGQSALIADVRIDAANLSGTARQIVVSDYKVGRNVPIERIRIRFDGIEIPVLDNFLSSQNRGLRQLATNLVALGYQQIRGNIELGFRFDPENEFLHIDMLFEMNDLGYFSQTVEFGGVTPRFVEAAMTIVSNSGSVTSLLGILSNRNIVQTLEMAQRDIVGLTLREFRAEIRDTGGFDRFAQVEAFNKRRYAAVVESLDDLIAEGGEEVVDFRADIRHEPTAKALTEFFQSGGRLVVRTKLDQPLAFFRRSSDSMIGIAPTRDFENPVRLVEDGMVVVGN